MLTPAPLEELPDRSRPAAVGRAAHSVKAHMVCDTGQYVCVTVLAEKHRQVTVTPEVERNEYVLVPEDVNPRAVDAVDRVDRLVVEHGPVIERAHPAADRFRRHETAESRQKTRQAKFEALLTFHG